MHKILTLCICAGFFCTMLYAETKQTSLTPFTINYSNKGLLISNPSKSYQIHLSGYIEADGFKSQNNIADFENGADIRRARLNLDGIIASDWAYALGYEFRVKEITNANIAYIGWRNQFLKVGQFYPNVSFSNWTVSTDINFLEVPMAPDLFAPNYSQGIAYGINNNQLALHVSGYTAGTQQNVTGRAPLGASARLIYSPIHTETHAIDLGISSWYDRPDGSKSVSYGQIPEIKDRHSTTVTNTGTITNVAHTLAAGLEAAYVQGPWSAQGEYISQWVNRDSGSNLRFDGYYIGGSYFLTGESLTYSFPTGFFYDISPIHHERLGAWEVLAQFSRLNLNNADIHGGKENNITVGLNWFPNRFFEFKLDYIRVMAKPTKNGNDENDNIFGLRAQVRF